MSHDPFSSFAFRNGVRARNRLWLAPLTNQQSHDDGTLSDVEQRWLLRRARGGFGTIETCAALVDVGGKAWPGELGIAADAHVPGLTALATDLRDAGALSLVQLFHGGVRAPRAITGRQPVSASAFAFEPEPPRALDEAEIVDTIGRFRDAAVRAWKAGFSGVELHGAHGYLFGQFLSRTQNTRTDRFGGDFEGRSRLLRETFRAVRAAVPASFLVGVRLSPEDFGQATGLDLDESLSLARGLADDGADFLHLSLWDVQRTTAKRPESHPIPLFRAVVPADLVLAVAGKVWTPADASRVLSLGADAVVLGRAGILNPEWPVQAADPAWEPRRPPITRAELETLDVSPEFAIYLRQFRGLVAD